jgi:hypothetical protein
MMCDRCFRTLRGEERDADVEPNRKQKIGSEPEELEMGRRSWNRSEHGGEDGPFLTMQERLFLYLFTLLNLCEVGAINSA